MNTNLELLFNKASKKERLIIGLMSGTSLDGLDIALCRFTSSSDYELLQFCTIDYLPEFKDQVRKVFAKKTIDFEHLCMLNPYVAKHQANLVLQALKKWNIKPEEIDFIASHGQTVYHAPKRQHNKPTFFNSTLQIGDGDHMAVDTGITTVSDFRQKHIALGGEGAPLAHLGDFLLASSSQENRVLLNMGGIANFTFLSKSKQLKDAYALDTGPGNVMLDQLMQKHFKKDFDKDAAIAKTGKLLPNLLQSLENHPYFKLQQPKTTGPEVFNLSILGEAEINEKPEDILHTLCAFTAKTISNELQKIKEPYTLYMSGGGAHNPLVVDYLKQFLGLTKIQFTDNIGLNADAKEAILFAALANEAIYGKLSLGKISFAL